MNWIKLSEKLPPLPTEARPHQKYMFFGRDGRWFIGTLKTWNYIIPADAPMVTRQGLKVIVDMSAFGPEWDWEEEYYDIPEITFYILPTDCVLTHWCEIEEPKE